MWVSGSLIRSSTWRSSSVSAPCISSSICLPSSADRSRTIRGSFCQALPIGCMRVFITPSCSSAVTFESRCSGALEFGILVAAHDLDQLVAREHQLGDHGHQVLERVDMHADRLVGDLGVGTVVVAGGVLGRVGRARVAGGGGYGGVGRGRGRGTLGTGCLAERALELVERDLARTQRPLQHLRHQRADGAAFRGRTAGGSIARHALELRDQILIVARLLRLMALELVEQRLDAVDGRQDQRDRLAGDRRAVAEIAHQRFGGMRQRFEPRQPEEAAGPLDGVNEAKDVVENLGVVRLLLEANELDVDDVEAFARLGQEFAQQTRPWNGAFDATREPPHRLPRGNQIGTPPA